MKLIVVCLCLITLDSIRGQVYSSSYQPYNYNRFNFRRSDGPLCAKDGEYVSKLVFNFCYLCFIQLCSTFVLQCQTGNDCCSKSCLSFAYKCVKSQAPQPPLRPVLADNRFGEGDQTCAKNGDYV